MGAGAGVGWGLGRPSYSSALFQILLCHCLLSDKLIGRHESVLTSESLTMFCFYLFLNHHLLKLIAFHCYFFNR